MWISVQSHIQIWCGIRHENSEVDMLLYVGNKLYGVSETYINITNNLLHFISMWINIFLCGWYMHSLCLIVSITGNEITFQIDLKQVYCLVTCSVLHFKFMMRALYAIHLIQQSTGVIGWKLWNWWQVWWRRLPVSAVCHAGSWFHIWRTGHYLQDSCFR
jgi:hypothetical protein